MALLERGLKQRIVGALVLIALAVIFLPMLFTREDESRQVVVEAPPRPQAPAMPSVEVLTGIVHVLSLDANLMFYDSETSDELKDAMAMLRQISPERQQFILEIIQMAYKEISQTEGEHE